MAAVIRLQCCRRCKHGEPVQGSQDIECRRFPPTVTPLLVPAPGGKYAIHVQTVFPRVNPDMFCSEFATKLASAVAAYAPPLQTAGALPIIA